MTAQAESILVVAGEASADAHGAKVLTRLHEMKPALEAFGIGGERLTEAGLHRVADAESLSVVGISEALRGLASIRAVYRRVLAACEQRQPGVALLLDLPDFNLRLARRLRHLGVPVVYYIAPQAWAWRKGRVRQLRRRIRKLCVVFPFEEPFFREHGVPVEYVGHPLLEESPDGHPDGGIPGRSGHVAIIPGSRVREIERLLPALAGAAGMLQAEHPELKFVLPLAPGISGDRVGELLGAAGVEARLIRAGVAAALRGARLALVTSGTATLEAALAGVPMVVVYRVSRTTYALVRPVYRLDHVCIVNILAGERLVPELIQGEVNPAAIAEHARALLPEGESRQRTLDGMCKLRATLGERRPSRRVAEVVADVLEERAG